jgi:hypothetical protein
VQYAAQPQAPPPLPSKALPPLPPLQPRQQQAEPQRAPSAFSDDFFAAPPPPAGGAFGDASAFGMPPQQQASVAETVAQEWHTDGGHAGDGGGGESAFADASPFDAAWTELDAGAAVPPPPPSPPQQPQPAFAQTAAQPSASVFAPAPVHAAAGSSIRRAGGALELTLAGRGGVSGAEKARFEVCGERVRRAGLRGTLHFQPAPRDAAATSSLCVGAHPGVVTQLWAHARGAAPGSAPHLFALHGGPALAYQLRAAAAAAALPLRVTASAAGLADQRSVMLAVRVVCAAGARFSDALFEADAPAGASGPPLAMAPHGEWDAAARVVRWRLDGAPPSGRMLLRARFAAAYPGAGAPADARVRGAVTMPFHFGSEHAA